MSNRQPTTDNTRACFQCESGRMARTDDPEPGWSCQSCGTFVPDDQDKPRPHSFIRVQLGGAARWRSVELLEIGMGRVRVEDETGERWVLSEHIHPDDRAEIRRKI